MKLSNTFRRVALGTTVAATLFASSPALAALTAFVAIKGQRMGQFKGEGVDAKRKDKWIPVTSFTFSGRSPRDITTGVANGRRQFEPICIVKEWGPASPQIWQALTTNEILTEVSFEFSKTGTDGTERPYQTVKLTNATISVVRQFTVHPNDPAAHTAADTAYLEEACFTFSKIEMINVDGKTLFADDWRPTT